MNLEIALPPIIGIVVGAILAALVWIWPLFPVKPSGVPTAYTNYAAGSGTIKVSQGLCIPWLNRVSHAMCNVYPKGKNPADCSPADPGTQMMYQDGATSTWSSEEFGDPDNSSDQFAIVWIYWYAKLAPKRVYKVTSGPSANFTPP
jgi:hypothetical protein